jgi:hypothetical protein
MELPRHPYRLLDPYYSMKNRELFLRDPATAKLMNNGQARISDGVTPQERETLERELREELSNFVCEGQYADGLLRVMESFLSNISATNQPGAWVSGFYGSGKSHLLKMLGHLWVNTEFASDGVTARSLVPGLPTEVEATLKELDIQGRRAGGLHAALGVLPSGSSESVRLTILGILLRSCGLPEQYRLAKFCLYLKKNGFYDSMVSKIEAAGNEFNRELVDLSVSPVIRKALLESDPTLGSDAEVRDLIRSEFSQPSDIDTSEFLRMTREILTKKGELPLTIIVLDEVQIFVRNNLDRTRQVVEAVEALEKQMGSRVLVVGAGQSALSTEVPEFPWMRARFTIPVELSDADVENVTRRILLAKRPEKVDSLRQELSQHVGEIERQLSGTALASRGSDRDILADDYPILPVRRRFWELVSRAVDPAGTSSMLRTQLSMIHGALHDFAEENVGHVVPADFMFEQLQAGMVQQGVLLREIDERIRTLNDGTPDGHLASRLCSLVFLVRKLPREAGADCGVRATPEILADLLVSDLANDGPKLRKEVPLLLQKLAHDGILLKDGEEFNLQTRESLEWEKEFKNRVTQASNNEIFVHQKREAYLRIAAQEEVTGIRVQQGAAKVQRKLALHFGAEPPLTTGSDIPVWIRDGWSCSEKNVVDSARAAGTDSPVLFVFIPKASAEELRQQIVREEAASGTISFKGAPSTREGDEAYASMSTRSSDAQRLRKHLVNQIIGGAKVFKGGGTELIQLNLMDKVREGANDALDRLFPRFSEANHKNWSVVIGRARSGDDSPLSVVDWPGTTERHAVTREVLLKVGAGMMGSEVRKFFGASPFGWDQDAIDGALIALHAGGHLTSRYNNGPLVAGQLDQNKIAKTEFRTETIHLTAQDKIKLRGLFQDAGIAAKASDDLEIKSTEFLAALAAIASKAGGSAPLPEPPKIQAVGDLRAMAGNERLSALLAQAESLKDEAAKWKKSADLAEKRLPLWNQLQRLLSAGHGVPDFADVQTSSQSIVNDRLLLDTADHLTPLVKQAAQVLRSAVTSAHQEQTSRYDSCLAALKASDTWRKLDQDQRSAILADEGIAGVPALDVGTDDLLVQTLQRTPVAWWHDKTAALPSRFQNAAAKAAKLLTPKAQKAFLPSRTLHSAAELDAWIAEIRTEIETKLKEGPVIV